jgi:hypothetical protein
MATTAEDLQIELARRDLSDKLDELRRRAHQLRTWMSPATYWNMPMLRFGVGFVVGYALGRRPASAGSPSMLRAVIRAGLAAASASLVRQALDRDHE